MPVKYRKILVLLVLPLLLFSCSERRQARREALERIKAQKEEPLIHPLVEQVDQIVSSLRESEASLKGEGSDDSLEKAEKSFAALAESLRNVKDRVEEGEASVREIRRLYDRKVSETPGAVRLLEEQARLEPEAQAAADSLEGTLSESVSKEASHPVRENSTEGE